MRPISGAATDVPPKTCQPETPLVCGPYIATPVLGSATAETSASMRLEQPVSVCQAGFAKTVLQPLPAPVQATSSKLRALPASRVMRVPPKAMTPGEVAGYCGPAAKP